jgi:hypothetical protein
MIVRPETICLLAALYVSFAKPSEPIFVGKVMDLRLCILSVALPLKYPVE